MNASLTSTRKATQPIHARTAGVSFMSARGLSVDRPSSDERWIVPIRKRTGTPKGPGPQDPLPRPPYGTSRSAEPARFQLLPLWSVTPCESVTTTGNCAPATEPAATIVGFAVIVTLRVSRSVLRVQVAFVPQMMSATVFVLPPEHAAGPMFVAFPQSLSVTRKIGRAHV